MSMIDPLLGNAPRYGESVVSNRDLADQNVVVRPKLFDEHEAATIRATLLRKQAEAPSSNKFTANATELLLGRPDDAARGVASRLGVTEAELHRRMAQGVLAIVDECEALLVQTAVAGADLRQSLDNLANLEYVLYEPAGQHEGLHEPSRAGQRLAYFMQHPNASQANLSEAQVVALRWYTTIAYKSMNEPLRDIERAEPHPLAATVAFLREGLTKLHAIAAPSPHGQLAPTLETQARLWRGMRNVRAPDQLMSTGGTELAPASFTHDLAVAAGFAAARTSLLFVINTDLSFMQRGAPLQWLSTAPFEQEFLLPPCTYLEPTGRKHTIELESGQVYTIVEVTPYLGG